MAITAEALEMILQRIQAPIPVKHFTHCPARFNGTRTLEAVDDFITSADFFKTSEGISDANAVAGLSLLLEGPAHTWWTGVKVSVTTWEGAKTVIREEFAPALPAYKVYLEVFATPQKNGTPTGLFVSRKRALLAQLRPEPAEDVQLDMIYGLLTPSLRSRIPRTAVVTFTALLAKAREAEDALAEPRQAASQPTQDQPKTSSQPIRDASKKLE